MPVQNARMDGDSVIVPFPKDKVKDAPSVDLDGGHLDQSDEQRLYEYYGLSYGNATPGTETSEGVAPVGRDTSGPETDDAMTRSEERLTVGTTSQESGRVRLRKYVTTEMETQTVPVRKEKAVLEREPITDANVDRAAGGPAISEEEHEVVLHEERPVVGDDRRAGRAGPSVHRDRDRGRNRLGRSAQGAHRGRGRRPGPPLIVRNPAQVRAVVSGRPPSCATRGSGP